MFAGMMHHAGPLSVRSGGFGSVLSRVWNFFRSTPILDIVPGPETARVLEPMIFACKLRSAPHVAFSEIETMECDTGPVATHGRPDN